MNTDNNHLIDRNKFSDKDAESLEKAFGTFTPVPPELTRAAKLKLAGQKQTIVSRNSGGKLSKWAASQRRNKK